MRPTTIVDDPDDEAGSTARPTARRAVNVKATNLDVDLADEDGGRDDRAREERQRRRSRSAGLTIKRRHRRSRQSPLQDHRRQAARLERARPARRRVLRSRSTSNADGLLPGGSTVIWPYYCGNLFPCHSPARRRHDVHARRSTACPPDKTAVYPADDRRRGAAVHARVGGRRLHASRRSARRPRARKVSTYWLPGGETAARAGTQAPRRRVRLVREDARPVLVRQRRRHRSRVVWGAGVYGGMEHHPYWHVAKDAMSDEVTHVHEAAHGWFGDGIRLVLGGLRALRRHGQLSRGARARQGRRRGVEAQVWAELPGRARRRDRRRRRAGVADRLQPDRHPQGQAVHEPARTCAARSSTRTSRRKIGADVLDSVIGDFYKAHKNQAARHAGHARRDQGRAPASIRRRSPRRGCARSSRTMHGCPDDNALVAMAEQRSSPRMFARVEVHID